ncbi:MAG TPA: hypothetical protein VMM84_02185 [Pyrinomonadaceae bacterium]|nr:hypothetical protein [Pyrinomonadaceae bacterium]
MRIAAVMILIGTMAVSVYAQRPRTIDPNNDKNDSTSATQSPTPPPAPQTFKAKYEGGIIGYTRKQDGTLSFDDANRRLLFRNKENKEVLSIPYAALLAAYPDTQSRRPTAATVIGSVPAPYGLNIPAWFVRKKYRYLTLNFQDPDTNASGITSFKVENKELLASVLHTLAGKSGLTQRGDGYVRKKNTAAVQPATP